MKPPSERNQDFLEVYAEDALRTILEAEAGPKGSLSCIRCTNNHSGSLKAVPDPPSLYRCFDCIQGPILCSDCILSTHTNNPFHSVQEWDSTRGFWSRRSLTELGFVLNLGHTGHSCPLAGGRTRNTTVVHEHGVHQFPVRF